MWSPDPPHHRIRFTSTSLPPFQLLPELRLSPNAEAHLRLSDSPSFPFFFVLVNLPRFFVRLRSSGAFPTLLVYFAMFAVYGILVWGGVIFLKNPVGAPHLPGFLPHLLFSLPSSLRLSSPDPRQSSRTPHKSSSVMAAAHGVQQTTLDRMWGIGWKVAFMGYPDTPSNAFLLRMFQIAQLFHSLDSAADWCNQCFGLKACGPAGARWGRILVQPTLDMVIVHRQERIAGNGGAVPWESSDHGIPVGTVPEPRFFYAPHAA